MVDRCVCFNKTFSELKSIAQTESLSDLESLQRFVDFGKGCGLCKPYVKRMLETGRVVFPVIRTITDLSE